MFWQISLYFVNQCLFLKMWFNYFVVWWCLINEGERDMIWSSIIFIELSMFGSWSSLVCHFVVTTLVLWFQGPITHTESLMTSSCLSKLIKNTFKIFKQQLPSVIIFGFVYWHCLGPLLNFLFWLTSFKATRYLTHVAFNLQAPHESIESAIVVISL